MRDFLALIGVDAPDGRRRRDTAFDGRGTLHLPPGGDDASAMLTLRQADLPALRRTHTGRVALPGMRGSARPTDVPDRNGLARQGGRNWFRRSGGGRRALGLHPGVELLPCAPAWIRCSGGD